jgi:hypothetical protein
MGPTLTYPMKKEMSLVHHVIGQWGCSYIIKDGKGLNERTSNDENHVQTYASGVGVRGYGTEMITKAWIR